MDVVIGLDVGTGGARAIAVNASGEVITRAESRFENPPNQPGPGMAEQDATAWWSASRACLQVLSAALQEADAHPIALAIDSTSGTIVPVDPDGLPLMPALMYNDGRAAGLEDEVNQAAGELTESLGYNFPPAFALVKLVWLLRHRPEIVSAAYKFLHASDYLIGQLTGNFNCTDTSNALKTGVDLHTGQWPAFIESVLHLPLNKFPAVHQPGQIVALLSASGAASTGLPVELPVVAGATDGTTSFLASGASQPGDWNITIGTTIVIRGVSGRLIKDPLGRFYCHRHPDGYWLPGGASNVGGESLVHTFGSERISALDEQAVGRIPTSLVVYPLVRQGERMPFVNANANGFVLGMPADEVEQFAGYLEGIALVSVWSVEEAALLGAPAGGEIFLCGGGAHGRNLGPVMASLFGRPLIVAREPDAVMGSAILAAAPIWFGGSVIHAQQALVQRAEVIMPVPAWSKSLQHKLKELKAECHRRSYL